MSFPLNQLRRAIADTRNSMSSGPQVGLPRVEMDLSHAEALANEVGRLQDRVERQDAELEDHRTKSDMPVEVYHILREELGVGPTASLVEAVDNLKAQADEAENELDELRNAVAGLRDMFPVPDSGTPLENEWLSAMGSPQEAAAYVDTRIRELQSAQSADKVQPG